MVEHELLSIEELERLEAGGNGLQESEVPIEDLPDLTILDWNLIAIELRLSKSS